MKPEFLLEDIATMDRQPADSLQAIAEWFSAGKRGTRIVMEAEGMARSHPLPDFVQEEHESVLSYAVMIEGDDGQSAEDRYKQGDCEVFAVALETAFGGGGELTAVFDPMEPDSSRVSDGEPYLVHAGYRIGDTVYDIEGAHEAGEWASRWMENGNCSDMARWGRVSRQKLEAMQSQAITDKQIAIALPFANLVKALAGPQMQVRAAFDRALLEANSELPEFFFHGTSTLYLENMLKDGLQPCNMTGEVLMSCLTDDVEIAIHHAECMAEFETSDPMVFRIPTSRLDVGMFTLEDNFVRIGPSAGRGIAVMDALDEEEWTEASWTWRAMLELAGAVGYTAAIPVALDDLLPGSCAEEFRAAAGKTTDEAAAPSAAMVF